VQVWAEDEARFGLLPTYRRQWTPKGQRVTASSLRKYSWFYLFAFIHPRTGALLCWRTTTVSTAGMSRLLRALAEELGLGPQRHLVLVVDKAGWHQSKQLVLPDGLHLAPLPAYSPELQPTERVWPLVREALANRHWSQLEALGDKVDQRCQYLMEHPEEIQKNTCFHWWPADIPAYVSTS
jgi:transposase